ncbi:MAG: phospholipase D family protein [Dehalococcoidales bacterium]|nr:phospholipase D family protein [Dehalococcoidales bacterium]
MAEFLTTHGASYHIENIIKDARKELVLISPYLQLSQNFFERLLDADKQGVGITLVYGKDELKSEEREKLRQLKNLSICYFENIHAKCYYNEDCMVITSMNMYEFSEKTNREMGVLIRRSSDKDMFEDAVKESESIIAHSKKESLTPVRNHRKESYSSNKRRMGFCIRCNAKIPFDMDKPLCDECYKKWDKFKDPTYKEKYCHGCGQHESTSKEKPVCYSCYKFLGIG